MGRALFLFIPLWLLATKSEAIDLSAAGGWGETVNASDLVAGAGTKLIDTYESLTDATYLAISDCTDDSDSWRVDARRVDEGGWYGDFTLYVERTSNGTGNGSISGELSYVEINSIDTQIFSGTGDRSNITIQYKLTGMSINVSPSNYNTMVLFTVVDIP